MPGWGYVREVCVWGDLWLEVGLPFVQSWGLEGRVRDPISPDRKWSVQQDGEAAFSKEGADGRGPLKDAHLFTFWNAFLT